MKGGSNRLLSAEQTADMLGINVETVYRQWRAWGMRGFYVGRQLRFRERDVETWIDSRAA